MLCITSSLWMSLNNAEEYLEGGYHVDGARLCLVVCSNGTRDNEHRLEHRKCHTDMRKKLLTVLVTGWCGHWNRLPRDVLEAPSLEIFKTHMGAFLCGLL